MDQIHLYEAERESADLGTLMATLMPLLQQVEAMVAAVPCKVELHLRLYEPDGLPLTLSCGFLQILGRIGADLELCADGAQS